MSDLCNLEQQIFNGGREMVDDLWLRGARTVILALFIQLVKLRLHGVNIIFIVSKIDGVFKR